MEDSTGRTLRIYALGLLALLLGGCHGAQMRALNRWNPEYADLTALPPIVFHCDHGVLADSYPEGVETLAVRYEDVCAQLGHVCLCGAGGYRIASLAEAALRSGSPPLEREEFVLISSRDHTVSDVIALVLGCARRGDPEQNQYFIDNSINPPRREYHYYIAYPPAQSAVQVIYRKHLLIGHEEMDRLWDIESAFERDPNSVTPAEMQRYQQAMVQMVRDVLFDQMPRLITVTPVEYEEFQARLGRLRK